MSGRRPGPLKYWLSLNDSGTWGDDPSGEGDTVVLRSTDIALSGAWAIHEPALRQVSPSDRATKLLSEGDLVVVKSSGSEDHLGKTAIVSADVAALRPCFANFVQRLRPATGTESRYVWYLLNSKYASDTMASLGNTTTGLRNLNGTVIGSVTCPISEGSHQRAIADFLDRETARIDALIAAKRRLVELTTLSFNVRCRQMLTGNAPPDGWEPGRAWLGAVPTTWTPMKVSRCLRTGSGTTPPSDQERYYSSDAGTAWVTTAELRETEIRTTSRFVTDVALRELPALMVYEPGTVLVAMYGATVGRVGRLAIRAATNQACCALFGDGPLSTRFVYWWLRTYRSELMDMAYGAGQPNISQETIRTLRVPAPNIQEQEQIAISLERAETQLYSLTAALNRQIDLLTERRQALITAAVTGQLEIPGVAA